MKSNTHVPKKDTETIFAYNTASGEIQIIVPKREDNKYLTTEKYVVLDPADVKRLYALLKDIFE